MILPERAVFHSSGTAARMSMSLGSCLRPLPFAILARRTLSETSAGGFELVWYASCWALWLSMRALTMAVQTSRWSSGWEGPGQPHDNGDG